MTKNEQARQRLVEIALACANPVAGMPHINPDYVRQRAGFRDPSKGHWSTAGLTAAMEDAGLLVPASGTPARCEAIALLDWVDSHGATIYVGPREEAAAAAQPGDIIAWLQHPPPDPAGWRRGHAAVIVATDSASITTVGWNEGPSPGRVMKRRLWRGQERKCEVCAGVACQGIGVVEACPRCEGTGRVRPSETVLARKQGLLYGIARPVAAWWPGCGGSSSVIDRDHSTDACFHACLVPFVTLNGANTAMPAYIRSSYDHRGIVRPVGRKTLNL